MYDITVCVVQNGYTILFNIKLTHELLCIFLSV